MQTAPERFGLMVAIRHDHRYEAIFSREYAAACDFDFDRYCYYFEQPYAIPDQLEELYAMLRHQIQYWKDSHRSREMRLSFEIDSDGIEFSDSRYDETAAHIRFGRTHADVY
jgi:hypothetical protein